MKQLSQIREINIAGKEFTDVVVALTGLSFCRKLALLLFMRFEAVSGTTGFQVEVPKYSGMRIRVFEELPKKWSWEPLEPEEEVDRSSLIGTLSADFCIFLSIGRQIDWKSEEVTLSDGSVARFTGHGFGSLLKFMGRSLGVESEKIRYLANHPERLDEDIDVLRDDLNSDYWAQAW